MCGLNPENGAKRVTFVIEANFLWLDDKTVSKKLIMQVILRTYS